jgi:hypothetical protein
VSNVCWKSNLSSLRFNVELIQSFVHVEALQRIVGVNPAFMRPRTWVLLDLCVLGGPSFLTSFFPAYGAYNDLVRQVSGVRGQKIVIWDFEYVP